jgi:hypothetical protein
MWTAVMPWIFLEESSSKIILCQPLNLPEYEGVLDF